MKVWVTKCAFTEGVVQRSVEGPTGDDDYVISRGPYPWRAGEVLRLNRDAFVDRKDAIAAAEKMRVAKIATLKRQIANLKTMSFSRRKS